MINVVHIVGRLGKDPEVRYTQSGKAVANFTVATDESYKNNAGEKVQKAEWHRIVVWGPSVENYVQPYLHKGDLVAIIGKLQTREYQDQNGTKHSVTEINVQQIKGLVRSDKSQPQSQPQQVRPAAAPSNAAAKGGYKKPAPAPARPAPAAQRPAPAPVQEPDDSDFPF